MRDVPRRRREWLAVWTWAVLWAVVMLVPYQRRLADEWHNWRFTGIAGADFNDSAYHLSFARQAQDGRLLFESKYAGTDTRGHRFFNLYFLTIGLVARFSGLGVAGAFLVVRSVTAVLVLVAAYWFAAQFFVDRQMRWLALVLATTSGGLEGFRALTAWPPGLYVLDVPQTNTFWYLTYDVVIGPTTGLVLLTMGLMWRALTSDGPASPPAERRRRASTTVVRRLMTLAALSLLQAAIYPHDVQILWMVAPVAALAWALTAPRGDRGRMLRRGVAVCAALVLGAAPLMVYHLYTFFTDYAYRAYGSLSDQRLTGEWPQYFGLVLAAAVVGAAAVLRRRERGRLLLVVWALVIAAFLATRYPKMQRVHLYHGLHVVLCVLAVRGLWAGKKGTFLISRPRRPEGCSAEMRNVPFFPARNESTIHDPESKTPFAVPALALFAALASVTNVANFVTALAPQVPRTSHENFYTFLRPEEVQALAVLDREARSEDVIACVSDPGVIVPMWTGSRVWVGHEEVTPEFGYRQTEMNRLMGRYGPVTPAEAARILSDARANYLYVEEFARRYGSAATEEMLVANGLAERLHRDRWTGVYRVNRAAVDRLRRAGTTTKPGRT
jgi:hypothetical protein